MLSGKMVHVFWGLAYGYFSISALLLQLGVLSMVYEKRQFQ